MKLSFNKFILGTETIKRGASPPSDATVRIKESTSINSIKQPIHDQSFTSSANKSNKDETKITESSSSGPNTSSIQSYDKPTFSKSNLTSIAASSSNNYKHYSSISTTRSSPVDKFVRKAETSESSPVSKEDDIMLYKPSSYSLSSSPGSGSSSSTIVTKTVSVKTNGTNGKSSTTVTNNFKLPPFPVYVPSTSLPSTIHLTSDSGLSSKTETSTTAFSSKYSDSPASSSVTTAYSTTLSRLSSSSSSPSRTINNVNTTNTLPLHLGRNNPYLYQSESNFTNSNVTSTSTTTNSNPTTSYSSPVTSYPSSQTNYNNVYSTLPKTTASSYSSKFDSINDDDKLTSSYSSYKYSTDYYSNLAPTTNNTSTNGTSTYTSSSSDNNMFRVQYSATNPFLDPIEASPSTTSTLGSDNISSLLRGSVSETKKKFEKLDSEEDLK